MPQAQDMSSSTNQQIVQTEQISKVEKTVENQQIKAPNVNFSDSAQILKPKNGRKGNNPQGFTLTISEYEDIA